MKGPGCTDRLRVPAVVDEERVLLNTDSGTELTSRGTDRFKYGGDGEEVEEGVDGMEGVVVGTWGLPVMCGNPHRGAGGWEGTLNGTLMISRHQEAVVRRLEAEVRECPRRPW
ncbi:unnamed protein product [Arctogadus glacialis]